MALRKITKAAGHWLAGLILKVDSEIQFDTTGNPEIDSTGGNFIWKVLTGTTTSWKLRDDTKNGGQDIIVVDSTNDEVNIPAPYDLKIGGVSVTPGAGATNLSEGTTTNTTVDVNSDTGTNATLAEASTTRAGVMSKAKFDEVVANTSKVSNVDTDLSIGTKTGTTVDINSSDGTNATIPAATITEAGLLQATDKVKLDATSGSNTGDQDLSGYVETTDIDTLAELNSVVTDATLIDTTDSRLSDSRTCDNTFDNAATARTNLGVDAAGTDNSTNVTLDTDLDTTGQAANLVGQELELLKATSSTDGVMSSEDKTKLDAITGTNTGDEVSATDAVEGIVELATQGEVNTGTDTTRVVTPDTLEDKTYGVFSGDIITDNATLKTALQELETAAETGVAGVGSILATVTGVDATSVANTNLFTVPAATEAVVRHLIVRLKTISGAGNVPKVSIGTNSTTFDNIITSQSLSGLSTAGDAYTFIVTGVHHVAAATEVITLRVNNAASYTTYSIDVDLVGYTI